MFDVETVKERLQAFGYEVKAEDEFALTFCLEKVRNSIKNNTNQEDVPERLQYIAVDRTVGEFLLSKKTFSPKELEGIHLDYAVKEIQAGDTRTVFSVGEGSRTPEQRLDTLIDALLNYGKEEFHAFRRMRW